MSLSSHSARNAKPSAWAISFLMLSIMAAVTAVGLLTAEFGLL